MKKITIMSLVMMAMLIIISCSKDDDVTDGNHGNDGGGGSPIVTVVINEDGTTSNGSTFSVIDEKNFYLDYIKYTIEEGHLIVSGYDQSVPRTAGKAGGVSAYGPRTGYRTDLKDRRDPEISVPSGRRKRDRKRLHAV